MAQRGGMEAEKVGGIGKTTQQAGTQIPEKRPSPQQLG